MFKFGIGQPLKRVEDNRLLTGKGIYTDDISFEDQAYMYIIRSPYSNALIKNIDYSEALKIKGVLKIISYKDIKKLNISDMRTTFLVKNVDGKTMPETTRHILAEKFVRYAGDPVLAIIAENLEIAEMTADNIYIDYEEKNSITNLKKALNSDAPVVREELENNLCFDWEMGKKVETLRVLQESTYQIKIELLNNRLVPNPMECRSTLGIYDKSKDVYNLYCSSQGVHSLKRKIAKVFNSTEDKFNIITKDVGGGFGMKIFNYPEYIMTLAASKILNRPIKWRATRTESFLSDIHGRDHYSEATLGLDSNYKFTSLSVSTLANIGSYISDFAVFIPTYAGTGMLTGCYDIPLAYANVKGVYTNTNPTDAYRGAGRPEAAYLIERLVDKAAYELGLTAFEIRKINLIDKKQMPYKTALGHTYDSGDFKKNLEDAAVLSLYKDFENRKLESNTRKCLRGIGISTYIEACGGGGPETAEISVDSLGQVNIKIGTQSNGQGHETSYSQIASEILNIDLEKIKVFQGDSTLIEKGSGTGGSRSTPVGGSALHLATTKLVHKAKLFVSKLLKTELESISYKEGFFYHMNNNFSLADISNLMRDNNETFSYSSDWAPPPGSFTYPNGTHICELEIDIFTGKVSILNYSVVDDFGKVVNPLLLEGQVHGGIVQGIGQALYEETVYDENSGQLMNGSFMDYAIPRASDVPNINFEFNEILCKNNLLGVKGAGEAGAIGAPPAVINAICNALQIEHIDMPAKPEKIWKIINKNKIVIK